MRETEEQLTDLQGRYDSLSQSYETLLLKYLAVKQELERTRNRQSEPRARTNSPSGFRDLDEIGREITGALPFDASEFCYQLEEGGQK
jgi:hypothetical protein